MIEDGVGFASALRAGRLAGRWRTCARCGDDIWPNERVFPMVTGGTVYDGTFVLCVVCEVKRQIAEARAAVGTAGGGQQNASDLVDVQEARDAD